MTWRPEFVHPWFRVTKRVTQHDAILSVQTRLTDEWLYSAEGLLYMSINLFYTVSF